MFVYVLTLFSTLHTQRDEATATEVAVAAMCVHRRISGVAFVLVNDIECMHYPLSPLDYCFTVAASGVAHDAVAVHG